MDDDKKDKSDAPDSNSESNKKKKQSEPFDVSNTELGDFKSFEFDTSSLKWDDVSTPDWGKIEDFPTPDWSNVDEIKFENIPMPDWGTVDDIKWEEIPEVDFGAISTPDFSLMEWPSVSETGEPLPEPDPNLTAADVAKWMLEEVNRANALYQDAAAYHILRHFGSRFVYRNRNGNLAISPEVLKEFLFISKDTVVWIRRERYWRIRQSNDPSGREVR